MARVLYADPSYTCTGLFLIDTETNELLFDKIKLGFGTLRKYENYFRAGVAVADSFDSFLQSRHPSCLKIEIPPPIGQTSSGLTGLNYLLLVAALRCASITQIELITPSFISAVQRSYFGDLAKRPLVAREFLRREGQSSVILGRPQVVNADQLEDNDVATAYLFYVFELLRRAELRAGISATTKKRKAAIDVGPGILDAGSPFTPLPTRGINLVATMIQEKNNRKPAR